MTSLTSEQETFGHLGRAFRLLAACLIAYALVLSHRNFPLVLVALSVSALPALLRPRPSKWVWFAYALIGWAGVSAIWSPYEDRADWPVNLLILAAVSWGVFAVGRGPSLRWMRWGSGVAFVLLGIEAVTGGWIRDLTPPLNDPYKDDIATARGITCMIMLMPALLLAVWQEGRVRLAMAMVALLIIMGASFGITANLMAVLLGLGVAGVAWRWPQRSLSIVGFAAMAGFIVTPLFAMVLPPVDQMLEWTTGPASWRMRLTIWKDVWAGVMDDDIFRFLFGHGVEAARVLGDEIGLRLHPGAVVPSRAVPTHPHNLFLQIWYDLGLVGVLLSVTAIRVAFRRLSALTLSRGEAGAVAALVAVVLVFSAVDASLWTLWRVAGAILGGWMLFQVVNCNKSVTSPVHGIAPQQV